jgi:hypothetical protein
MMRVVACSVVKEDGTIADGKGIYRNSFYKDAVAIVDEVTIIAWLIACDEDGAYVKPVSVRGDEVSNNDTDYFVGVLDTRSGEVSEDMVHRTINDFVSQCMYTYQHNHSKRKKTLHNAREDRKKKPQLCVVKEQR